MLRADRQLGQVGQQRAELGVGLCVQCSVEALVELVLGQAPGRKVVAERVGGLLTLLIGYAETVQSRVLMLPLGVRPRLTNVTALTRHDIS
jgi:hypothetical protein